MYELSVQAEFAAAHAISILGQLEPLHGHNWLVTAIVAGPALNPDGLLCDFHAVERALREIVAPFHNANLNDLPPFSRGLNPTAEYVARHIAERLGILLAQVLPATAALTAVRVTEAPGCAATYRPPSKP